jgi:hypothetical protein
MPFPRGVIDPLALNTMQQAMDQACCDLEVSQSDEKNRDRVAFLVTGFMRAGVNDIGLLTNYVIHQFRHLA